MPPARDVVRNSDVRVLVTHKQSSVSHESELHTPLTAAAVSHRPYRADVDGLRALAVSLVVLYHLGCPYLPGGFIGVDVFFVISGFLITQIILVEITAGTFSLSRFYQRRVQRILPALLVCSAATLMAGALLLDAERYAELGRSCVHSMMSFANVFFYEHTGYFDTSADLMPMLHTWSLAVEEQFYVAWPLLFMAVATLSSHFQHYRQYRREALAALVATTIVVSLLWSMRQVTTNPKGAFFLPFARAWELACGGAVAFAPRKGWASLPRAWRELLQVAALLFVFVPAATLRAADPFPGVNALLPVVGAVVLVLPTPTGSTPTLVSKLLGTAPLPWLGLFSYSLYLWHWPTIVYWRWYTNGEPLTTSSATMLLVASTAAGWLSWRVVETPTRALKLSTWHTIGLGVAASTALGLLAGAIAWGDGIPSRIAVSDGVQRLARDASWAWEAPHRVPQGYGFISGEAQVGVAWEAAERRAVAFGDSHMQHMLPMLDATARRMGMAIAYTSRCHPVLFTSAFSPKRLVGDADPEGPLYDNDCTNLQNELLTSLADLPTVGTVILGSAWSFWPARWNEATLRATPVSEHEWLEAASDGLRDLVGVLASPHNSTGGRSRRVVVVADTPRFDFDPLSCVVKAELAGWVPLRQKCIGGPSVDHVLLDPDTIKSEQMVQRACRNASGVVLVSPISKMCSTTEQVSEAPQCFARLNGEFLYRDHNHFRRNLLPETMALLGDLLGWDTVLADAPRLIGE